MQGSTTIYTDTETWYWAACNNCGRRSGEYNLLCLCEEWVENHSCDYPLNESS